MDALKRQISTFSTLEKIQEHEANNLLKTLGFIRKNKQRVAGQIQSLHQALEYYQSTTSGSIESIQNARAFIKNLRKAIETLEEEVNKLSSSEQSILEQWREKKQRAQGYGTLVLGAKQQIREYRAKQEQKNLDEVSSNLFYLKKQALEKELEPPQGHSQEPITE